MLKSFVKYLAYPSTMPFVRTLPIQYKITAIPANNWHTIGLLALFCIKNTLPLFNVNQNKALLIHLLAHIGPYLTDLLPLY